MCFYRIKVDKNIMTIIHLAAKCGFLDVLKFFHKEVIPEYNMVLELDVDEGMDPSKLAKLAKQSCSKTNAAYHAGVAGHLDILLWLDKTFPSSAVGVAGSIFSAEQSYDNHLGFLAIANGHLHILKHIHIWHPGVITSMMQSKTRGNLIYQSVRHGHLNVTEWLVETFPDRLHQWFCRSHR